MASIRGVLSRFASSFRRRRLDRELDEELRSHLEMAAEEHRRQGMTAEESRNKARRDFGGVTQIREHLRSREGWPFLENLRRDVGYALRQMMRAPGFTAVVVLTLALPIGANTAVFNLVDAFYLKPLALPHSDRLARIFAAGPSGDMTAGFSYQEFQGLRNRLTSFTALAVERPVPQLHLVADGDSAEVQGAFVSADYFDVLGVQPDRGRSFLPAEDTVPGRDAVAIISDRLWKSRFDGNPAVLGSELRVNGVFFRVIGVTPPGFNGDLTGFPADLWLPAMMAGPTNRACEDGTLNCALFDQIIGRLAPGRSFTTAQAEARSGMVWSATDWPERPSKRQLVVRPANGTSFRLPDESAVQMQWLMFVTGLLLVVASTNLAGLLLARGTTRRREIAVRLSVGASRSRVIRQLVAESLVLAFAGEALGLLFSIAATNLIAGFYAFDSEGYRQFYGLQLDWRAVVYSMAVALVVGVLFGLVPAFRTSKQNPVTELKEGRAAGRLGRGWLRNSLVIGQVAVSMALVVCAVLLLRSSLKIGRGTHFDPAHVVVFRLRPELIHYTPQQTESLIRQAEQRLSALPDVESVAFMRGDEGLMWNWQNGHDAQIGLPGSRPAGAHQGLTALRQDVSAGFFHTLRIPLLQGREFEAQDRAGSPVVAVLNQALATRLWPQSDAVGRFVVIDGKPVRVIGVCADIQPQSKSSAPEPHLYLSYWQSNASTTGILRMAVRVAGDPAAHLAAIRRVIQSIDQDVPIGEAMPMAEQIGLEYMAVLLARDVGSLCALLALCLSAMGLYSTLAFAVRARTHEIGVRMALGATRGMVLRLVIRQGTWLALAGVTIGVVVSMLLTRLVASLLFGVEATDLATYLCVVVVLVPTALAASYLPARRAASIDPVQALRAE